jgi:hypothetical protein
LVQTGRRYNGARAGAKQLNDDAPLDSPRALRHIFLGEVLGQRGEDMGFLARWVVAFGLLASTFNPTELNFITWARANVSTQLPLTVLLGLLLMVGYIIYLRATLRSIGGVGMALVLAIAASLIWVLHDFGLVSFDDPTLNVWLALVALSLVLGIGLSWSHVRRRLSGQADMDDVDE